MSAGCSSLSDSPAVEEFDKSGTEWIDSTDKSTNTTVLGPAALTGNNLVVALKCYKVKVEVSFDGYYWKYYSVKGKPFWGGFHQMNVRPTGAQRKEEMYCAFTAADMSLTGFLSDGQAISPVLSAQERKENGNFIFPIKNLAQSLPKKPSTLAIAVSLASQPATVAKITLDSNQVTALNLQSENWLNPEVLTDLLMARITTALKSKNYHAALPWFKQLEERGENLPESFYYYYIEALSGSGERALARVQMNAYIVKYGKRGKYYAQVIELMSKL